MPVRRVTRRTDSRSGSVHPVPMLSRLRRLISNQLSRPSGLAGRVVAAGMNRGNRAFNARAIEALDVQPGTRVLDLGFGGGLTFGPLLERGATVVGVDRAEDMVAAAAARHRADVEAGRIAVHAGDVLALPLEAAGFSPAEVHTAPEGTSHLVTATRGWRFRPLVAMRRLTASARARSCAPSRSGRA